jgi:predicted component of type VI protein secretion system
MTADRLQAATLVELLAERRENVLERSHECDRTAKAMIAHHIATIDAELARRRQVTS